jgi:hypothetical protein
VCACVRSGGSLSSARQARDLGGVAHSSAPATRADSSALRMHLRKRDDTVFASAVLRPLLDTSSDPTYVAIASARPAQVPASHVAGVRGSTSAAKDAVKAAALLPPCGVATRLSASSGGAAWQRPARQLCRHPAGSALAWRPPETSRTRSSAGLAARRCNALRRTLRPVLVPACSCLKHSLHSELVIAARAAAVRRRRGRGGRAAFLKRRFAQGGSAYARRAAQHR